ncbi:hypothetical protein ACIBCN_18955 [Nocardia sp. NPDC051052]|uniref:hypothetical protein n=1 Tax=Nocardia sp. NPDC051052 TaxID=3364322 RepID=UPI0037899A2E
MYLEHIEFPWEAPGHAAAVGHPVRHRECRPCAEEAGRARWFDAVEGPPPPPRTPHAPLLYQRVRRRLDPADVLDSHDRRLLVTELHELGCCDRCIGEYTLMTLHHVERLRAALGLDPHPHTAEERDTLWCNE